MLTYGHVSPHIPTPTCLAPNAEYPRLAHGFSPHKRYLGPTGLGPVGPSAPTSPFSTKRVGPTPYTSDKQKEGFQRAPCPPYAH